LPDADATPVRADDRADLALLIEAATAAAPIALGHFRSDPQVWLKAGNSPVSEADLAVDRFLRERLLAARPDYGWLSEETADDPARLGRRRVFVVDPIDGTRAYLAGRNEWAISAAVVEDGQPVAGVLLQPAVDATLTAVRGGGAFSGGTPIRITVPERLAGARVGGSRRLGERPEIAARGLVLQMPIPSLALRFARVAEGRLDVALASPDAHDWDLAAADLIVREAGGRVADIDGAELVYNAARPRHAALAAGAPALMPEILALVRDLAGRRGGAR
jgi:myo-inositol-1(or 4)-monophosphatase